MHSKYTLNSVLVSKGLTTILLVSSFLATPACRKEIDPETGSTTTNSGGGNNGGGSSASQWTKITDAEITDVRTLAVYNNQLYAGGCFANSTQSIEFFARFNAQENLEAVGTASFIGYGVYALKEVNGQLIIGGDFSYYQGSPAIQKSMFMDVSGSFTGISFCYGLSDYISQIVPYNSGMIFTGNFDPSGTNSASTSNIDFLQGYTSLGMGGTTGTIRAVTIHQGNPYMVVADDGLYCWNGSFWNPISYLGEHWSDIIYSVASYNGDLYILGKFYNGVSLKKLDETGTWSNNSILTQTGSMNSYSGLQVVNNSLVVHCPNLQVNGQALCNLAIFNGTNWHTMNIPSAEIRELAFFNGTYYAATDIGVFKKD